MLTSQDIFDRLSTVLDPELHIDIVSLGLIYNVIVERVTDPKAIATGQKYQAFITMTLTTPGCPLAGMFDGLVKSSLVGLPELDPDRDVHIELTFDPPWLPDMMTAEARAELGFD